MPGIVLCGRRWNISNDDFFYPGLIEFKLRAIWLAVQLSLYLYNQKEFQCPEVSLLHIYYVGFGISLVCILIVQFFIIFLSSRGTISNAKPRRHINIFLYTRFFLMLIESIWSIVGLIWLLKVNMNNCAKVVYFSVLANIIFFSVTVVLLIIILLFLIDPISHLEQDNIELKRSKLFGYLRLLFCCCFMFSGNSRDQNYENSFQQITSLLEMVFRGGDLTPTDITAGILLLSKREKHQYVRESMNNNHVHSNRISEEIKLHKTAWMNVNEASHYVEYACSTYTWSYFIYMKSVRGCCELCCSVNALCCCCLATCCVRNKRNLTNTIDGDNICNWHLKTFKKLSKVEDCDIIYANFRNELFHAPFVILLDHHKKTVVIAIRGTLSLRDVITDLTAECGLIDIGDLKDQKCHLGMLNTATNIYNKIKQENLLEKAFSNNRNYRLMVTGHSLGAGVAVLLSLKLKPEYPDLRCIAYSAPGGLLCKSLSDYTKSFILTVIVGDDVVTRLSIRAVHSLKARVLQEIHEAKLPKHKIFYHSVLPSCLTCEKNTRDDDDSLISDFGEHDAESMYRSTEILDAEVNTIRDDQSGRVVNETEIMTTRVETINETSNAESDSILSDSEFKNNQVPVVIMKQVKTLLRTVYDTYEELKLPGQILYIYQNDVQNKKSNCCSSRPPSYDLRWADREEFKKIIITQRMLIDHFPNTVESALKYFCKESVLN